MEEVLSCLLPSCLLHFFCIVNPLHDLSSSGDVPAYHETAICCFFCLFIKLDDLKLIHAIVAAAGTPCSRGSRVNDCSC